jgi:hypothetical protein
MNDFPEQIGKLEKEGQNYDEEGRMRLIVSLLLLYTSINCCKEEWCESEK